MPPPAVPPGEAGDPEVSSRRVSPNPAGPEGSQMAPPKPYASGLRKGPSDESGAVWCAVGGAEDLLGRASISEEHRALMGTVIERISSAESGLHEAVRSLLTGFEVREIMYPFWTVAHK